MNELTINLKQDGAQPLYEQIYIYIKENIKTGAIACGEKLPSTRALSRHLEVSRSTVELAYEQLLSEGYIEAEPCRGFFVSQIDGLYNLEQIKEPAKETKRQERKDFRYDFTPNGVDLKSFPYNVWRKLSREILTDDRTELFRLGHPQGEYGFRAAISRYLYQARGVNCTPEQVIVGAGSDYLLMLLCTVLGRNHTIAVENPTYKQALRQFHSQFYDVCPIPLDKQGIEVEKLKETKADVAYVTPSHQYPTGIVMPIRRRMELLKWAEEREGRYIIEDDYDSEFRYKGKPIPALKGYDRNDKVIYLGTFSKSIAPAIRLSYMVLPEPVLDLYQNRCGFLNSTVSKVDQLIVERFIEDGYYERHLNKTRALYKNRHDQLIAGLRPLLKTCRISGEHAGVHLLLHMADGRTEQEFIHLAAEAGVRVYGLSDYIIGGPKNEQTGGQVSEQVNKTAVLLLGYANLTEEQIKEACGILCRIWKV